MGPYGQAAWAYRHAGWAGVLPLLAGAKWPPPRGYTGWAGVDPSGADVQAWCDGSEAAGNVALRLPVGVLGVDIDDYGAKTGGVAFGALAERVGVPLPGTWVVSSREESASGIRLYRAQLEVGRRWRDEPAGHGAGVEAIHHGHRYAVVWPSIHPEGRKYRWRRPDGAAADGVPRPGELSELPAAWIEALSEPGETRVGEMAGHTETAETVAAWRTGIDDASSACPRVAAARERAVNGLTAAAAGAPLHTVAIAALHELANLGHEGHAGVRVALAEHYSIFVEVRSSRGESRSAAEGEWWRMVRGAIGKLPGARRERCDCDIWTGKDLLFDPGPVSEPISTPVSLDSEKDAASAEVDPAGAMLAELLTPAQIAARPAPTPLVHGLLYTDTLSWLIGKSGSFKSFVALDVAARVAGGLPWAGRRTLAGPVLYLVAEGAGGMSLRVRAWMDRHGEMPEALQFLPRSVQARGDGWAVLVEVARRLRPVLVVVDTQARVTVGVNENDNAEMGAFIEQIDRLRRACGACVLVVHHIGRHGTDARGASAIDGAQDTELKVERVGGARTLKARLVIDKQKDGPDTAVIEFAMESVDLGTDPTTGDPLSSLVLCPSEFVDPFPLYPWQVDPADKMARILGVLHEQFSEAGGTAAGVLSVLRERGWSTEYPRTTFYRWWNELQRQDKIEKVRGTQRWILSESAIEAI